MRTLPENYTLYGDLFADVNDERPPWHFVLVANLLALIPLGIVALGVWLPYQFYVVAGAPFALWRVPPWRPWVFWLVGALIVVGSMILHEALHGLALAVQGHKPRFGHAPGYLYATTDDYLTRREYLLTVLLPVAVITGVGTALLPFLPASIGQIVLISLLLNAAASIGDLAVAGRARRFPPQALFADQHGIKVYLPRAAADSTPE